MAKMPSIISGQYPVHVAHVRFGCPNRGKRHTGMGEKPDDRWTLPLTPDEHMYGARAQHKCNEHQWWADHGIDPIDACLRLHKAYSQISSLEDAERLMRQIILEIKAFREPLNG